MIERNVVLATVSGKMDASVHHPERGGPFPMVAMLMDGAGIGEALLDNARMLAAAGYYVILPNLYHRAGRSTATDAQGNILWDEMSALNASLDQAAVAADIGACIAFAGQDAAAGTGPIGLIGYCMGGRLALLAADSLGAAVAAVVSLHPGFLATGREGSPHRHVAAIAAEIYIGAAETDPYLKPHMVGAMRDALSAAGVRNLVEVLPGSTHGFALPGREYYHRPSALLAWERTFDLFGRTLGREADVAHGPKLL